MLRLRAESQTQSVSKFQVDVPTTATGLLVSYWGDVLSYFVKLCSAISSWDHRCNNMHSAVYG